MDELKEFVEHGNEFGVKKWLTKYKIAMVFLNDFFAPISMQYKIDIIFVPLA